MVIFKENTLDIEIYLELRKSVKWKKLSKEQAKRALKNSLYTICAYDFDFPIGMGRLVGDGAVICYVQDLVVRPEAQAAGVGGQILEMLIAYAESLRLEGTELMLDLMCAKGREEFYKNHGFLARPTENLGPGMIQYLKDNY
ncbi:MAG: GNAT family N-acetyltransferase [Lachnospiraceae bacterium]|jgi:GNAT superfamily N-acetyltransferase|nr:GNAT family N-acetyltransferase [Lachnospiraceae bacterium]